MKEVDVFLKKFGIMSYDSVISRVEDSFYFIPDNLKPFMKYRPSYVGKKIGFMRGNNFIPSIDLLQWISKRSKKTLVLDPELEWQFICGNNIQRRLIPGLKDGETLIILNAHKECIGLAEVADKYLRRIFDIGDLLRRERSRKSR